MNQSALSCPKCNGEMINGFVMDSTFGAALVSQWVKGSPQIARASFGILPQSGIEAPKTEDVIPIATFRCQSCGFLESYAREEFAAK